MSMRVVGLDLSLTSTGVASTALGGYETWVIRPKKITGHERLRYLVNSVNEATPAGVDLVVVEGPSYGAKGSAVHQIAGLWWMATHELWEAGLSVAIAPPSALKKYATGNGQAGKDAVLMATARRFPDFDGGNDAADALWLAAMGADHLGHPLVQMPAANRAALDKVTWPEGVA